MAVKKAALVEAATRTRELATRVAAAQQPMQPALVEPPG